MLRYEDWLRGFTRADRWQDTDFYYAQNVQWMSHGDYESLYDGETEERVIYKHGVERVRLCYHDFNRLIDTGHTLAQIVSGDYTAPKWPTATPRGCSAAAYARMSGR